MVYLRRKGKNISACEVCVYTVCVLICVCSMTVYVCSIMLCVDLCVV